MNINAVASNPIKFSAADQPKVQQLLEGSAVRQRTSISSDESENATLRIWNCRPFFTGPPMSDMIFTRETNPFNERLTALRKDECCWGCRHRDMDNLAWVANDLVEKISVELQNFRQTIAKDFPALSSTPFDFTVDANGKVKVLNSELLSDLETAFLTEAMQDYEPLRELIMAHAETIISYVSFLKRPEEEEPFSYKHFGALVNYAALLADTTGKLNIFGQLKENDRIHANNRRRIDIEA
ncbi:hypothetical protein [Pseudomonas sp. ICMP 561]|uniref:hypothetical protein n=1 Tax=Pseudomonas sp. ICMP 561 TaxID=1718918 RepID=UPI000C08977D|nr:hypothetical protein [Pseudomonas sp. ICMP 561]PHN32628.1 hypothetical protein AO242_08130 [Pseudomonas sp. ICMP 561]